MIKVFALLSLFFLASCGSSSKTTVSDEDKTINSYQELAKEKYGDNTEFQLNDSETYVICSTVKEETRFTYIQFFVVELSSGDIIYLPNRLFRNVRWDSESEIVAQYIPGTPEQTPASNHYIYYDVKSKTESTTKPNKL